MEILYQFNNMVDLDQINLDKYMVSHDSPLTNSGSTKIGMNQLFDNAIGAASLSQGRINTQLTIGGINQGNLGPYLRLDGKNDRIVSNDGTNNRIIIGSV